MILKHRKLLIQVVWTSRGIEKSNSIRCFRLANFAPAARDLLASREDLTCNRTVEEVVMAYVGAWLRPRLSDGALLGNTLHRTGSGEGARFARR